MDSGFNVDGQASALNIDPMRRYCVNDIQSESVRPHESFQQFTTEKINNSFCHRINTSTSAEQELCLRDNTCQNKGLTSWLMLVMLWYLIVSFPDHFHLSYFHY